MIYGFDTHGLVGEGQPRLAQFAGAAILAIAATGMIYASYLIGNLALLRARLRGWPKAKAPFSLGRWGLPLNVLALLYGGAMLINFAWPRGAPSFTNPTPYQEVDAKGHLQLNFGWHWLNNRPVLWTVFIVINLIGAVYFVLVQRTKPQYLQAPEGEVLAEEAPPAVTAT